MAGKAVDGRELLEAVVRGDQSAWDAIVAAHGGRVRAVADPEPTYEEVSAASTCPLGPSGRRVSPSEASALSRGEVRLT